MNNVTEIPQPERLKLLKEVPFLALLPGAVLEEVAHRMVLEAYPPGTEVVREGEAGDRLYLIAQGRAEVTANLPAGPVVLASLEAGELFGEIALLHPSRQRQATVTTLTPLLTLTFSGQAFQTLLDSFPDAQETLNASVDILLLAKFLKQASPFARLDPLSLQELAARMERREVPAGTVLVRQGELGDTCFLLRSGCVEVVDESQGRSLATLRPGALFGEAALLTDAPRNATVRTLEPCELLVLRRAVLLEVLGTERQVYSQIVELLRLRNRPRRCPGILAQQRTTPEGDTITVLKDPVRGAYYRLSSHGWFLWQRLDGRNTIRDLTLEYLTAFKAFAPNVIAEVVGSLAAAGFVEALPLRTDVQGGGPHSSRWRRILAAAQRLLEWRLEWRGIDAAVSRLHEGGFHWLFKPAVMVVLLFLAVAGLAALSLQGTKAMDVIAVSPTLLWFLVPAYLIILLIHEAGHAFATKACGCQVLGAGIGWYWVCPIAYVDTSDLWLAGRWPRIAVSVAGTAANFISAGLASLAAFILPGSTLPACLWIFALVSYVAAILSLNPVMEYDGYYVLMDLLERPNLRVHCLQWLRDELPQALRDPERLRGHWMEMAYALGSLLYLAAMAFLTLVLYRVFLQDWMSRLLLGPLAASLGWIFAVAIVVLLSAGVAGELTSLEKDFY